MASMPDAPSNLNSLGQGSRNRGPDNRGPDNRGPVEKSEASSTGRQPALKERAIPADLQVVGSLSLLDNPPEHPSLLDRPGILIQYPALSCGSTSHTFISSPVTSSHQTMWATPPRTPYPVRDSTSMSASRAIHDSSVNDRMELAAMSAAQPSRAATRRAGGPDDGQGASISSMASQPNSSGTLARGTDGADDDREAGLSSMASPGTKDFSSPAMPAEDEKVTWRASFLGFVTGIGGLMFGYVR